MGWSSGEQQVLDRGLAGHPAQRARGLQGGAGLAGQVQGRHDRGAEEHVEVPVRGAQEEVGQRDRKLRQVLNNDKITRKKSQIA